jgi:hypothetical protein
MGGRLWFDRHCDHIRKEEITMFNAKHIAGAGLLALCSATAAMAHHGWSWAEGEQTELTGIIRTVSFAPPHPSLSVDANGESWQIDLGNPRQTERSGFREGAARPGDEVNVLGNRSLDKSEKRMKAVRITISGKNYDMYPDRIKTTGE